MTARQHAGWTVRAYRRWAKRLTDLVVAGVGVIVLLPFLILLALVLSACLRGWPLFVQERTGLNGRPFRLVKLRTMNSGVDQNGKLLPDEERLGVVGGAMRAASLDELPSLVNVVLGHMSLVGPRPLLPQYLDLYTPAQARRHLVKPGITGWAQIHGRNAISWERKFELDLWYVEHYSALIDLQVLIKTVSRVIAADGVRQRGRATAAPFLGSDGTPRLR